MPHSSPAEPAPLIQPLIQLVEIELSQPLVSLHDLKASTVQALVKFHGTPIALLQLPVYQGTCSAATIAQALLPRYTSAIGRELARQQIVRPQTAATSWNVVDLLETALAQPLSFPPAAGLPSVSGLPSVTVALCAQTTANLAPCLEALQRFTIQCPDFPLEILVIESQPQTPELQQQVQQYACLRYLSTPAKGLNAARNLALEKAEGEILAFTDQSGVMDANWVQALATTFARYPDTDAVVGLVLPNQLATETQTWFETGYGLGRGLERKVYRLSAGQPVPWPMLGTMQIGAGVNMAFRRSCLEQLGGFDLDLDRALDRALDQASTGEGGTWEMFSRLLLHGKTLRYEPSAIVRYRIPQDLATLQLQITQASAAFYTYLQVGIQRYPAQWANFACLGLWKLAQLLKTSLRPYGIPRALIGAEWRGVWQSLGALPNFLWQQRSSYSSLPLPSSPLVYQAQAPSNLMAVRSVDLERLDDLSLGDLSLGDLSNYKAVRIFVRKGATSIGFVDLEHHGQPISRDQLQQAIADQLWLELLALPHQSDKGAAWAQIEAVFAQRWMPSRPSLAAPTPLYSPLSADLPISIIITTCDRPADLAHCLRHLCAQQTSRPVEIIVADNRPASGLTPPVVAQFEGVKLVSEPRPGGSYGRNAAITASTGEIIVSVDDDVTVPPDWLEKLIAPLARPEVMVVTGNVLPLELETPAQILFETLKGGLGEGFKPFEVDGNWWRSFQISPPTWDLGVSANVAFRATMFSHPAIGLMDEVLGPGTPTVGGEENHLLYKVLRAGYTVVYEPDAFVWHRHRRELPALYKQVYGHMKGGTAYHLLLWLQEKDWRGFRQLVYELPRYYSRHLIARCRGHHRTPWRLLWSEVAGYFAGYWGYWQSVQRVRQQGRSAPYVPVSQRLSHPVAPVPTAAQSVV